MPKKIDRTGETAHNTQGRLMKIVEYHSTMNMVVEFEDGERVSAYTMDGVLQGTATAIAGTASLNLPKGSVLLVRSSDESGISLLVE